MKNKLCGRDRRGFSLSELLMVLVLLAFLVPLFMAVISTPARAAQDDSLDWEHRGIQNFSGPVYINGNRLLLGQDRVATAALTNGAVLTLDAAHPVIILTGIGNTNLGTNTITLAMPYPPGVDFLFTVDASSSNLIALADNGTNLSLGAGVTLNPTDTLRTYMVTTNKAVKISTSAN